MLSKENLGIYEDKWAIAGLRLDCLEYARGIGYIEKIALFYEKLIKKKFEIIKKIFAPIFSKSFYVKNDRFFNY